MSTLHEHYNTGDDDRLDVAGLKANTLYHFRALATNSEGTGYGSDATFTTF